MKRIFTITLPDRLPDHIPALDGLRGMAILLVMAYHFLWIIPIFHIGWAGVDLFFVLSGFLITGILLDSRNKKNYYKNFIVRRALRIFPLYYLILFIFFVVDPLLKLNIPGNEFEFYQKHQGWFWTYMQNWLLGYYGLPSNYILAHFWSLAVEEQFYLLWPFFILLIPKKRMVFAFIILICFSVLFRTKLGMLLRFENAYYSYATTLSRMDALLIGGLASFGIRNHKLYLERVTPFLLLISGALILISIFSLHTLNFYTLKPQQTFFYTFLDLFFCCVLLLCLSKEFSTTLKIFSSGFMKFFGKYSYGLYVYHNIIYESLIHHFFPAMNGQPMTNLTNKIFLSVSSFLLTLIISIVSYHLWEKPFLNLKKYFYPNAKNKNQLAENQIITTLN